MQEKSNASVILSLCCISFAILVLFVWIPLDIETGVVEKVRRRWAVGDALAPSAAAFFILIGGLVLLFLERGNDDQAVLRSTQLKFIVFSMAWIVFCLTVTRYAAVVVDPDGRPDHLLIESVNAVFQIQNHMTVF